MTFDNKAYELFFGVITPVGTLKDSAIKSLRVNLESKGYKVHIIKLSKLIQEASKSVLPHCEAKRINLLMDAGNDFRKKSKRGDAAALLGILNIRQIRKDLKIVEDDKYLVEKNAYIFDSLKHQEEIESLRKIYQDRFYAISIYSSKSQRLKVLTKKIKTSRKKTYIHNEKEIEKDAFALIERDQAEPDNAYGQNIRTIFPLADLFVTEEHADAQINRFLNLLFGARFITPTIIEYGMFMAHSVALLSSDLSRQVGAAILKPTGEILSTGCNEVPLPGGEFFWEGTTNPDHDFRDYKRGSDANIQKRYEIINELLNNLKKYGWLNAEKSKETNDDLISKCLYTGEKLLKGTRLANLIEFGRIIHAEMAAITTAARSGVSIENAVLYCTTFPCHGCAKHIISAGIRHVYYIEPYPKSLTGDLSKEMVHIEGEDETSLHTDPVLFSPYIGIAPKNYWYLFKSLERKKKDGTSYSEDHLDSTPRIQHVSSEYGKWEVGVSQTISEIVGDKGSE